MTQSSLSPGTRLGHFVVDTLLGEGGMGVVYKAYDERLKRHVALKIVRPETLADATARARLRGEAQSAAALNHAHICTIFEIG